MVREKILFLTLVVGIVLYFTLSTFLFDYSLNKKITYMNNIFEKNRNEFYFCKRISKDKLKCYEDYLERLKDLLRDLDYITEERESLIRTSTEIYSLYSSIYSEIFNLYIDIKNKSQTILYIFSIKDFCPVCIKQTYDLKSLEKKYLIFPINVYYLQDSKYLDYIYKDLGIKYIPTIIINGSKKIVGYKGKEKYPIPVEWRLKVKYYLYFPREEVKVFRSISLLLLVLLIISSILDHSISFFPLLFLFFFFNQLSFIEKPFFFYVNIASYLSNGKYILSLGEFGYLETFRSPLLSLFFGTLWALFKENTFKVYFIISSIFLSMSLVAISMLIKNSTKNRVLSLIIILLTYFSSTKLYYIIFFPEFLLTFTVISLYFYKKKDFFYYFFLSLINPISSFFSFLFNLKDSKKFLFSLVLLFFILSILYSNTTNFIYFLANKFVENFFQIFLAFLIFILLYKVDKESSLAVFILFLTFLLFDINNLWILAISNFFLFFIYISLLKKLFYKKMHANYFLTLVFLGYLSSLLYFSIVDLSVFLNSGVDRNLKYLFENVFQYFSYEKFHNMIILTDSPYFSAFSNIKVVGINYINIPIDSVDYIAVNSKNLKLLNKKYNISKYFCVESEFNVSNIDYIFMKRCNTEISLSS